LLTESRDRLQLTRANRRVVAREGTYALTLDAFCSQAGIMPAYLKIDVDGTEPEILEGGAATLRHPALRSILIEMHTDDASRRQCERILMGAGFTARAANTPGQSPNQIWCRNEEGTCQKL
jgi:hypothetical protein